jgi:hypothetical protein
MFSYLLRKFDEISCRTLLWAAAGLVLLCQLMAVAFVADEQVAKARIRDYQKKIEMLAIAQCIEETRAGAARNNCIQQARVIALSSLPPADDSAPKAPVLAGRPGEANNVMASSGAGATVGSMLPAPPAQGFTASPFAVR